MVPPLDKVPYPTLGFQVCDFIESFLVFGPGDLRGEPARVDAEKRALIARMYEVYPQGHPQAGRRRFKRVAISLRKGSAKALALDTPLPTTEGWKAIGDVQAGDTLFDEQGRPCRVLATSEVFTGHDCYVVTFRDGSQIVADAGHLWYTEELRNRPYVGSVKTTRDIAESVAVRNDGARNHRIPVAKALQLPDVSLPVDPWILGAWLGDGRSDDAEFTTAASDYPHLLEQIQRAGYYTTEPKHDSRNPNALAIRVSISPIRQGTPAVKTLKGVLREMGLLDNKHVPERYLRAGIEQRLALLQGLMDTDGTTDSARKGYCAFTSTLRTLADSVYELAASLGLKPSLRINKTSLRGAKKVSPAWRVSFQAYADMPVFRMARKAAILGPRPACTPMSTNRHIVAVDKVPSVPTRCIAVDSESHLFLAGRAMIPTHNSEFLAWIAACELHPDAPVRCDGFDAKGQPVGMPVTDPYIPLVAYTEEQSDELAYGALRVILESSQVADDFDIGLMRIMRKNGDGKAVSLATSPDARDGARTTFQGMDETHRWTLPRLKAAHRTMMANIPKRYLSDAWSMEITTAPAPGEGSVAEDTMDYARQVADGKIANTGLFFFHRQAGDQHDLSTDEGVRAAVIEASGPVAEWSDIDGIVDQWKDPTADRTYLERVWLNRLVRSSERAFDAERWRTLAKPEFVVPDKDMITLGFDGARFRDSTALVGTHILSGHQFLLGLWEHPYGIENWEVPETEVEMAVATAFERWDVWRMYADPPYWETHVAKWAGQWGEKRVLNWWTNRLKPMAFALRSYSNAMASGELSHDGNPGLARHIGNAVRRPLNMRDDSEQKMWVMQKERPDSPHKIDAAMAGCLAWEARCDALAAGVGQQEEQPEVYVW